MNQTAVMERALPQPGGELPEYVEELGKDLEVLLEVAMDLREQREEDMITFLQGEREILGAPQNPHPDKVKYKGLPVRGRTKEYEVEAPSGRRYRFVVKPQKPDDCARNDNRVSIKFAQTYDVGENPNPGVMTGGADHSVLYLLPLVAKLPLSRISYWGIVEFLEKNNGFKVDGSNLEHTRFQDVYSFKTRKEEREVPVELRHCGRGPGPDNYKEFVPGVRETEQKADCYVTVTRLNRTKVGLDLQVRLPSRRAK